MPSINKAQVTYHLHEFAGTAAQWYIQSWCAFPYTTQGQHAALVVCEGSRTLGYWPLMPVTHDSLLLQLQANAAGPYPIPAVPGFSYQDELIPLLRNWAHSLAEQSVPVMNRILQLYHHLKDTPGVSLAAANAWWGQADTVLWAYGYPYPLPVLLYRVGRPRYREHASALRTSLQQAQRALPKMVAFLRQVPYPTSLPDAMPQTCSPLYPALAKTPVHSPAVKPKQAVTTMKRYNYMRYYLRAPDFQRVYYEE